MITFLNSQNKPWKRFLQYQDMIPDVPTMLKSILIMNFLTAYLYSIKSIICQIEFTMNGKHLQYKTIQKWWSRITIC